MWTWERPHPWTWEREKRGWKQRINHQGENLKDDWFSSLMSTFEGPCWIPPGKSTLRLVSAAEKSFPLRSCFQRFPGLLAGSKPLSLEMNSLTLGPVLALSPEPRWCPKCWAWSGCTWAQPATLAVWPWVGLYLCVTTVSHCPGGTSVGSWRSGVGGQDGWAWWCVHGTWVRVWEPGIPRAEVKEQAGKEGWRQVHSEKGTGPGEEIRACWSRVGGGGGMWKSVWDAQDPSLSAPGWSGKSGLKAQGHGWLLWL